MKYLSILTISLIATIVLFSNSALAGGCAPGQECWDPAKPRVTRPDAPTSTEVIKPRSSAMLGEDPEEEVVAAEGESSAPMFALAAGVNVLYFDCEDTAVAPGIFADFRPSEDAPLNIRLGVEGTEVDEAEQFQFRISTALSGTQPDFDFIRIPLSLEYVIDIADSTSIFVGGGPDLIDVSGDIDDTIVGLHLGTRIQQNITETIGISLGAGYLFAEADGGADDEEVDLDSAYTGVHLVANLF